MKTTQPHMKKHLSAPGLLQLAKQSFKKIPENTKRLPGIPLEDCLMSGLALFGLKCPSLLQFDIACRNDEFVKHNLKTLYGVMQVPCDTYMRERLDEVEPHFLKKSIDAMIAQEQRGKVLEQYRYFDEYCLVAIDASGYFSSHEIHCDSCCKKNHRDGAVTYYHLSRMTLVMHPCIPKSLKC